MGRYFEEFKIDEETISPGRTVTYADVVNFAGPSVDFNPLHTDEEYAKNLRSLPIKTASGKLRGR